MLSPEQSDNSLKSDEIKVVSPAAELPPEPVPRRFERFTLLARVARGGMGEVYLATAQGIEGAERPLIIKIVRPDHADDRSFVARFLDEARIQAQMQHPGVAQILEAASDSSGKPYVVVEYVEGRNLSDVRTRAAQLGVRISWPEAIALGVYLGEALTHVHERTDAEGRPLEIVHRDLSPQNVMIGYGGEVKLIDFGTARGLNRRCQTIAGIVFAKPGYVAPEVANNAPGGVPADLYAFGVILWELLAGRRFLSGEASAHLAAVGAGKRTLPPLARIIGAPPEIDHLLARLTATRIEERFESARAATQELVKLMQRAPSLADGDRSVRGRISDVMRRLYPAEPAKSRADFARRVAESRSAEVKPPIAPPSPEPPETSDPSLLPGTRYRLIRELGRGAMGVVHEALHLDLGRTVALKILSGDALGALAESRFRAEARAIAQLDQENLVKVYDFGACQDGRLFYAMELLDGESLDARREREKTLPWKQAVEFGVQICRALGAAHQAGVVHRDIKPANLFVTRAGTLKVLDFGVAKAGADGPELASHEGMVLVGTPEYMAPEQAGGVASPASDVYAVGVVLYELVTGALPFSAEGPLAILAQKAAGAPEKPSLRAPSAELPAELDRVILGALSSDPAGRPMSMQELERALAALLAAPAAVAAAPAPVASAGSSLASPGAPPRKRTARRLGQGAVALTLVACLALLGMAGARDPSLRASLTNARDRVIHAAAQAAERVAERRAQALAARPESTAARRPAPAIAAAPPAPAPAGDVPVASGPALDTEDDATEAADPAAALDPKVERALGEAQRLTEQGKELRALEILRRAGREHPRDEAVLGALSKALTKNRSWGEALRVARVRVTLHPSIDARFELARLERATGHRDRAVKLLGALSNEPGAPPAVRDLLRSLTGSERLALGK